MNKPAGGCLEDADTDDVANPERDIGRRTMVTKDCRKALWTEFLKDVDSLGRQRDVTIGRAMPRVIGPNNDRVRSGRRHQ